MNKCAAVLALAAATVFGSWAAARAQSSLEPEDQTVAQGQDWTLLAGAKLWANSWDTSYMDYVPQAGAHVVEVTGNSIAVIPNALFKYKSVFASLGYLVSGNYTFPAYAQTLNVSGTPYTATTNSEASRNEVDADLGYYFVPNVYVTMGYKNVTQKYSTTMTGAGLATQNTNSETYYNGVTFGIGGSAAIGSGFSLYGNGAGGYLAETFKGGNYSDNASYVNSEIGLAWTGGPVTVTAGYRYQIITTYLSNNDGAGYSGQDAIDLTNGWIFGLNYAF